MGILKHYDLELEKPLMVVVDTSVLIHKMHQNFQMHHSDPTFASAIQANLVWLMSGEWLGDYSGRMKHIVFATDIKRDMGYWRSHWLKDLENVIDVPRKKKALQKLTEDVRAVMDKPRMMRTEEDDLVLAEGQEKLTISYKAGRKLPEYSFTKLKKLTYKLLEDMGASVLGSPGFEADDIIAALCVMNRQAGNPWHILDLTVDSDHMQLIDESFTWVCMSGYAPTVRDTLTICNSWAERRLGTTLETWHDIVAVKGQKGDASDNLPPSNGVLIPVIDLLNPPLHYKYWLKAPSKLMPFFVEQEPRFSTDHALVAQSYLRQVGTLPVVRYLPGESPRDKQEPTEAEYQAYQAKQTLVNTNPF